MVAIATSSFIRNRRNKKMKLLHNTTVLYKLSSVTAKQTKKVSLFLSFFLCFTLVCHDSRESQIFCDCRRKHGLKILKSVRAVCMNTHTHTHIYIYTICPIYDMRARFFFIPSPKKELNRIELAPAAAASHVQYMPYIAVLGVVAHRRSVRQSVAMTSKKSRGLKR